MRRVIFIDTAFERLLFVVISCTVQRNAFARWWHET